MCNFVLCIYICIWIKFCRIWTKNANSLNIQNNYIVNAIVPWHVETVDVDKCFIFYNFFTVSIFSFLLQAETWNGTFGESYEKKETDAADAGEFPEAKARGQLPRPPALLHLLGHLCPSVHPLHITSALWIRTHWGRSLQKVQYGEYPRKGVNEISRNVIFGEAFSHLRIY